MKDRRGILSTISNDETLTDFERSVLRAILKIPRGEVRTYKWVAGAVGSPKACRAVGNALNKNPYAPAVPCHRVVKSDGSIGGFAKGPGMKRRLLKKEGVLLRRSE
ncbi:MAG: MGMT family protein [Candidatus Omnitrophica bacterium]|nr:MGMT family protein [Candidatus Omnitrophota bacterium]MDD5436152.1 MGMT family protein [Candidatus Omnitrophota bacterium]